MSWVKIRMKSVPGLVALFLCGCPTQSVMHSQQELDALSQAPEHRKKSSFVDKENSICIDGPPQTVEGALATMKSGPGGGIWRKTWARTSTTCFLRGYRYGQQENPCYPGVFQYYMDEDSEQRFSSAHKKELELYSKTYNLDDGTTGLLAACSCHPASQFYKPEQCKAVNTTGSWVVSNEEETEQYQCWQGPYEHMIRALSVMKTSRMVTMHLHDNVAARTCKDRGFVGKMEATKTDMSHHSCFPPAQGFFTDIDLKNDGTAYEKTQLDTGFDKFVDKKGLDGETLGTNEECNCLPGSTLGIQTNQVLCGNSANMKSPIRTWWSG